MHEGRRERAKARSVKMGRKPKLTPYQQREAIGRRLAGSGNGAQLQVHHATISSWDRRLNAYIE